MDFLILVLLYTVPCWVINAVLNLWYLLKTRVPKIAAFDAPLDLHRNFFDGNRIFGTSSTWVGLPIAILSGVVIESFLTSPAVGLAKGLAVYAGHVLGSFIKRRMGIPRGQFVPIVDHGDSIIVVGVVLVWLGLASLEVAAAGVILTLVIQPFLAYAGYKLGLRDNPQ